ncbi:hypothetical protein HDU96_008502 [Phlyctochytrium bullatum]|nr:hypothetical protein HDU96_008502 [Phlyctochytrium bullatum]
MPPSRQLHHPVLFTPEILANVFAFINEGVNLARCECVCRAWRDLIRTHHSLWLDLARSLCPLRGLPPPHFASKDVYRVCWGWEKCFSMNHESEINGGLASPPNSASSEGNQSPQSPLSGSDSDSSLTTSTCAQIRRRDALLPSPTPTPVATPSTPIPAEVLKDGLPPHCKLIGANHLYAISTSQPHSLPFFRDDPEDVGIWATVANDRHVWINACTGRRMLYGVVDTASGSTSGSDGAKVVWVSREPILSAGVVYPVGRSPWVVVPRSCGTLWLFDPGRCLDWASTTMQQGQGLKTESGEWQTPMPDIIADAGHPDFVYVYETRVLLLSENEVSYMILPMPSTVSSNGKDGNDSACAGKKQSPLKKAWTTHLPIAANHASMNMNVVALIWDQGNGIGEVRLLRGDDGTLFQSFTVGYHSIFQNVAMTHSHLIVRSGSYRRPELALYSLIDGQLTGKADTKTFGPLPGSIENFKLGEDPSAGLIYTSAGCLVVLEPPGSAPPLEYATPSCGQKPITPFEAHDPISNCFSVPEKKKHRLDESASARPRVTVRGPPEVGGLKNDRRFVYGFLLVFRKADDGEVGVGWWNVDVDLADIYAETGDDDGDL